MKSQTTLTKGLVSLLALALVTCGGDSPTSPTGPARQETPAAPALHVESLADDDAAPAADAGAFASALARLGDITQAWNVGDASSLSSHADWFLDVLRAPKSGTTFKVNKYGMLPQPAPKFRFKVQAPVSVPQSVILILFLTAGGKECGLATTPKPFPLTANVSRNVDIPNDYIIAGPSACFLDGQRCTPNQCKFPLNTTKMRIIFGHKDQGVAEGTESYKYKWMGK